MRHYKATFLKLNYERLISQNLMFTSFVASSCEILSEEGSIGFTMGGSSDMSSLHHAKLWKRENIFFIGAG